MRLYYIEQGAATLTFHDSTVAVGPGRMYLVPAFKPHSYHVEPDTVFYYMFIAWQTGIIARFADRYDIPLEVPANDAVHLLFTNYCQLYPELALPYATAAEFEAHPAYRDYAQRFLHMPTHRRMQLTGLVWILASYFVQHADVRPRRDERLERALQYIDDNIAQPVTTTELAQCAAVTTSQLTRLFRAALGTTPLQYALRRKIHQAQRLLLTTHLSVAAIAHDTGFHDTSYFIRVFKRQLALTPAEYRDTLR